MRWTRQTGMAEGEERITLAARSLSLSLHSSRSRLWAWQTDLDWYSMMIWHIQ